jgi:hypothetical protein
MRSALKAWGVRLAKRSGIRKAKVAVARKLAVTRRISRFDLSSRSRRCPLRGRSMAGPFHIFSLGRTVDSRQLSSSWN